MDCEGVLIPIDIFDQEENYLGHIELSFIPPIGSILAFRDTNKDTKKAGLFCQGIVTKIEIDVTNDSPLVEIEIDGGRVGL